MQNPLLFLFLLVGCGSHDQYGSSSPSQPVESTSVEAAVAAAVQIPIAIEASGQIISDNVARLAAGATGRVLRVVAERGASVSKGDTILRLDARLLTATRDEALAAVTQAEANLAVANDDCAKAETLFSKGLSNESALLKTRSACTTAGAALAAAKARLSAAETRVADTRVRAPFNGVVAERLISPGEYVRDDTPVFRLVGTSDLRIELTISEREAPSITSGQAVHFRVAGDTRDRTAVIDRVSPALREHGRDLVVEARIDPADLDGLRPGGFVSAGIEIGVRDAVAVPAGAVSRDGTDTRAFVITEGRAEERVVAVGASNDGRIPVVDGIRPGEHVIVPIPSGLRDGSPVVEL